MSSPPNNESSQPSGIIGSLKQMKEFWEIVAWIISGGTAIVALINSAGGPIQFLAQVGVFGFACYAAAWVILPIALAALAGLEKMFNRSTTDVVNGIVAGIAVLGGGALILSTFAPGYAKSLDAIGTAFVVLVGIVVLAIPFIVVWYFRGSKPRMT